MKITSGLALNALLLLAGGSLGSFHFAGATTCADADEFPFPGDVIYLGYNRDPTSGQSFAALQVPVTASDAEDLGWTETTSGKWTCDGTLCVAVPFGDPTQIALSYNEAGCLSGISVTGPRDTTLFDEEFYKKVEETPSKLGILEVSFSQQGTVCVNGETIPSNSDDAENSNWQEGGCVPSMGGSHYYKSQGHSPNASWNKVPPINPIYNKYGTKELRSFILSFGNLGTEFGYLDGLQPNNGAGFDALGLAITGEYGCAFNHCTSNKACTRRVEKNGDAGICGLHVMFYDPGPLGIGTWATCLPPTPAQECESCSCCGEPNTNTCPDIPLWMPPQKEE